MHKSIVVMSRSSRLSKCATCYQFHLSPPISRLGCIQLELQTYSAKSILVMIGSDAVEYGLCRHSEKKTGLLGHDNEWVPLPATQSV